jgi:hypothetical protein
VSLRNEITKKTGITPKLKIGKPGSLDIIVDGQVLYSKEKTGRMPTVDEAVALLNAKS